MSTKVTTEKIRRLYVAWSDRGEYRRAKEFDAWLAAHDKALREQIADDLRIEALNEDPDIPDTYREGVRDGLMRGVDIARGEEQTMSEREEYTPSMDEIKRWYAGAVDEYWCDTGMSMDEGEAAFDRAIATHDRALREQIEREMRADMFRGVRAWAERFFPGDRWDPQDALDLESALLGTVEANPDRSRARGEGSE